MGKHRTRLEILASILSVIDRNDGARKTQIMYQSYLSYKLLKQYLEDTTKSGLVKCENGTIYTLSKKGKTFLKSFDDYLNSRSVILKQKNDIDYQKSILDKMSSKC